MSEQPLPVTLPDPVCAATAPEVKSSVGVKQSSAFVVEAHSPKGDD